VTRKAKDLALASALANVIRRSRVRAGLTQDQLADACGLSQPTVSRLERGHLTLAVDEFAKVAIAMDVTPHELMAMVEDEMEPCT
jgi:transcriptional regulator with XRE-family HTH domain